MKTLFTLLFAALLSSSAFAYDEGRLTITVATKNDVRVMIDNRTYRPEDNAIALNDVQPGQHSIKIYRQRNGRNNGNDSRNDLLYSTVVYIKPNYHVDIVVNRFGKALVDERDLRSRDNRWDDDNWNNNGNYGNNDNYNRAMSDYDFNQLVQKIRSQWFGSKINTAKDAVSRNYFTTVQVRQLLQLFSADSDKLELAKLAYRNTVDPRNYHQLYDVFSHQSSRDELDRYTRDYRY